MEGESSFSRNIILGIGSSPFLFSRESRLPFLDESLCRFVFSIPIQDVCDMSLPAGVGDKKILRDVCCSSLSLSFSLSLSLIL